MKSQLNHDDKCKCRTCKTAAKVADIKKEAKKKQEAVNKPRHGNKLEIPPGSDYSVETGWGPFRKTRRGKTT